MNQEQFERMKSGKGFIAALDQSGGSTPKALKAYGIEEGQHIIEEKNLETPIRKPVKMLGHVTSSYFSPNLNKSIALAVVRGGKDMMGKKLFVPMENKNINVTVANPVFYDEKNERLNA